MLIEKIKRIGWLSLLILVLTFFSSHNALAQENNEHSVATTIIIVRHAEKASPTADDPPLTSEGEQRAETLAKMLNVSISNSSVPKVSVVFSTKYKRTIETVNNYADSEKIPIQYYDDSQDLITQIKSNYVGKLILVAAHSDTIEGIIQQLGVPSDLIPKINNSYNYLMIVTVLPSGSAVLIPLKYEIWKSIP